MLVKEAYTFVHTLVTVTPGGETVAFEGSSVSFTCQSSLSESYNWLINGTSPESFNLSSISSGSIGGVGVLSLMNISPDLLNSTGIVCCVQDILSEPSFLIIQGIVSIRICLVLVVSFSELKGIVSWLSVFKRKIYTPMVCITISLFACIFSDNKLAKGLLGSKYFF